MINVIIGENSVGKTVQLELKLNELGRADTITNMEDTRIFRKRVIDEKKVDSLSMFLPYHFAINGSVLAITDNVDVGIEYIQFLSDICSASKYFIYDEPEKKVKEDFRGEVYEVIGKLGNTFEQCWITSHYPAVTTLSNAVFYKVINKYTLNKVNMEDAIEILDPI